ncbi:MULTISPECIES: hypothetical protein [unclassified Sinorhizobium]|uniref:hypothetical protein n=1 Tax=unclassified Sinorhizobium TaxID=2613772 RepID=UPI003523F88D
MFVLLIVGRGPLALCFSAVRHQQLRSGGNKSFRGEDFVYGLSLSHHRVIVGITWKWIHREQILGMVRIR